MNAKEARKITDNQIASALPLILKSVEREAKKGRSKAVFFYRLDDTVTNDLIELGFSIQKFGHGVNHTTKTEVYW